MLTRRTMLGSVIGAVAWLLGAKQGRPQDMRYATSRAHSSDATVKSVHSTRLGNSRLSDVTFEFTDGSKLSATLLRAHRAFRLIGKPKNDVWNIVYGWIVSP